jgi:hypothetical protein
MALSGFSPLILRDLSEADYQRGDIFLMLKKRKPNCTFDEALIIGKELNKAGYLDEYESGMKGHIDVSLNQKGIAQAKKSLKKPEPK